MDKLPPVKKRKREEEQDNSEREGNKWYDLESCRTENSTEEDRQESNSKSNI